MKRLYLILLLSALLSPAQAALTWQPAPAGDGHPRAKALLLKDGEGARVRLILPSLTEKTLEIEDRPLVLRGTGMDNYHALVASRSTGPLHETAIRYVYLHGKPSGHSPSALTAAHKARLEIRPDPLPREHWRYQANHPAAWQLLFDGRPLAEAEVMLATSQGSRLALNTDARGRLRTALPDDFAETKPGRRGNRPAEFVLEARHQAGEETFITRLSAAYSVDDGHWKPTSAGAAVLGGGLLLGLGITPWVHGRLAKQKPARKHPLRRKA